MKAATSTIVFAFAILLAPFVGAAPAPAENVQAVACTSDNYRDVCPPCNDAGSKGCFNGQCIENCNL
ncbi:uncharacterized protein K452DRAFT_302218 [Aplosporella prunicola CBS 121167]|uniref:Uncharacterized protein n=1 Tax=Aplosporella prunicola CBS 121167 TaxID=1176127 RepID=A0A6A6AZ39_9PEZI|nr:uncharacterized protein K452DRAFT_302218 [Aplosporella prunicola CBS 121167]KAF2137050.1 hypothetical protein K452DRAFT_302218 [Aplosporella prunicola CBS 121167]